VVLGLLLRLILFMVFGLVARLLERLEEGVGAEGDQEDDHGSFGSPDALFLRALLAAGPVAARRSRPAS